MKYKRNELCWCGSGLKYKKCHLNRDKQQPVNDSEIFKQLNNFYDYKVCSAPNSIKHECSKNIIKAHSVSKSSSLKEIAKDGHVLTTFKSLLSSKKNFKIEPVKIGINKASTFTGFCSFHDNSLFSVIENNDFEITEYNCFLVAYRSIARELFVKNRASSTFNMVKDLDKGKKLSEQIAIQASSNYFIQNNDLTTSDLIYIKREFDLCFENKEFNPINHMVFTLDSTPKIMASAVLGLTLDFQGNKIQSFSSDKNKIPDYLIINSFSSNGIGYIILSWLETHKKSCLNFYKSLLKTASLPDSITVFIFAMLENIYLSEDWWNNLKQRDKDTLMDTFSQGAITHTNNDVLITNKSFGAFKIIKTTSLGFNHEIL